MTDAAMQTKGSATARILPAFILVQVTAGDQRIQNGTAFVRRDRPKPCRLRQRQAQSWQVSIFRPDTFDECTVHASSLVETTPSVRPSTHIDK
jgi:hypothetical protein